MRETTLSERMLFYTRKITAWARSTTARPPWTTRLRNKSGITFGLHDLRTERNDRHIIDTPGHC